MQLYKRIDEILKPLKITYRNFHLRGRDFAERALTFVMSLALIAGVPVQPMFGARTPVEQASKKKGKSKAKAPAPSSKELKQQQQNIQAEIKKTREDIQKNEREVSRSLNELTVLEDGIAVSKKETDALSKQVGNLTTKISNLESSIAGQEKELDRLRTEYLKAVKKMRVSRKRTSKFAYLFSAGNVSEAERRMRYLKEFSEWKTRQTAAINSKVESLKKSRDELRKSKSEKDVMLSRELQAQKKLTEQKHRQDVIVADLKANGEVLKSHLAKKQSEVNVLKNQVAAVIAEEQRRAEEQRKAAEEKKRRQEEDARKERERKEREAAAAEAKRKAAEQAERDRLAKEQADKEAAMKKEQPKKETPKKEQPKKEQPKKETPKKERSKKEQPKKEQSGKDDSDKSYAEARKRKPRNNDKKETPKQESDSRKKEQSKNEAPEKEVSKNDSKGDFAAMKGSLPRPVSGGWTVTGKFGRHSLPDLPDVVYDNPGIDVEVSKGAAVSAVYPGSVSGVYVVAGFGTVVIVNHGDYYTVYGNLASPSVKVGDKVKQGQHIGKAADSMDSPGKGALHFEVWKGREKLNPSNWIR